MTATEPSSPLQIEGARVRLAPLERSDRDALFAILADPQVTRYLDIEPLHAVEQADVLLAELDERVATGDVFQWGIRLRHEEGALIGGCSLACDRNRRRAEVGIYLGQPWWGQGYAREAVRGVLRFGFDDQQMNRIEALVYAENAGSRALLLSLGFREEGILREHAWEHGRYWDDVIYGLLAREFNR